MKTFLATRWETLRESFWLVPAVMVVLSIGLSFATLGADRAVSGQVTPLPWTYARGPEGSRAVLSTVAGSMMTIASLAFSITIVTLQLASSQYGPRLLRNFMRDTGNQVVLGTFIATFTYCLMILRAVNGTSDNSFVPHISVTLGLGLAIASLGVLIYFIHHTAEAIQAESVIAGVSRDLHATIKRLFPEVIDPGRLHPDDAPEEPDSRDRGVEVLAVNSTESDYLQAVDDDGLLELAIEHDLTLWVRERPGKFVMVGEPLLVARPPDRVSDDVAGSLRDAFILGRRRTATQDCEFSIDQLVEVALRALSPGINDPFTAIACIDRLGSALNELAGRSLTPGLRRDEQGTVRVVLRPATYSGIVDAAFHQIRQAARTNAAVTIHLLETVAVVATHTQDPSFRAALRRHASLIRRGAEGGLTDGWDRDEALDRYRDILDALETESEPSPQSRLS